MKIVIEGQAVKLVDADGVEQLYENPLSVYFGGYVRNGLAVADWVDSEGQKRNGLITSIEVSGSGKAAEAKPKKTDQPAAKIFDLVIPAKPKSESASE